MMKCSVFVWQVRWSFGRDGFMKRKTVYTECTIIRNYSQLSELEDIIALAALFQGCCKSVGCHSNISFVVAVGFGSVMNCVWTCWCSLTACLPPLPPPDGVSSLHPCSSSSAPPHTHRQQRHLVALRTDHGSHALSSGEHSGRRTGNRARVSGTLWAGHQRQPGGHRVAGDWGWWD